MKKIITILTVSFIYVTIALSQDATKYRMNVVTLDGNVVSLKADSITRVYFTTDTKTSGLTNYSFSGHIEKGPFLSSSTVTIQPIDEKMYSLGGCYSIPVKDNLGTYDINIAKMPTPYIKMSSTGYYYDECSGSVSVAPVTLMGIADLSKGTNINVNIFTHLKYYREETLVKGGMTLEASDAQAQKEILEAFGLQRFNDVNVNTFSITNGGDAASILISNSIMLLYYKHSGSQFSDYLANLANDFADDGKFTDQNIEQINANKNNMVSYIEYYASHLTKYYENIGKVISYPSLYKYIDWDNNGIAGDEVYDGTQQIILEKTEIDAPSNGGTYNIKIKSPIPVYTYKHVTTNYSPGQEQSQIKNSISYTASITDGVLTITINPSSCSMAGDSIMPLYDFVGSKVGAITLKQDANPNGSTFTSAEQKMIDDAYNNALQMISLDNCLDRKYTGLDAQNKYTLPISSNNEDVKSFWNSAYTLLAYINVILKKNITELNPITNIYQALLYTRLINYFGDVPYVKYSDELSYEYKRTSASTIYETLSTGLSTIMSSLNENITSSNKYDSIAFPQKDIARALLADVYMAQKNYTSAKSLLYEIEKGGRFALADNFNIGSKDLMLGFKKSQDGILTNDVYSTITYTDVLLKLAECEHQTNDDTNAKKHINEVATAKNIILSSEDIITNIKILRRSVLNNAGGYFAFLKRNNLAQSELSIKDYELLLPIPNVELIKNSMMTQNPGY